MKTLLTNIKPIKTIGKIFKPLNQYERDIHFRKSTYIPVFSPNKTVC